MAKRSQYNGLVSTDFFEGEMCALEFVVAKTAEKRATLRGYGNSELTAAQHLVEQMRFFADWIARRYGLPIVGDEIALRDRIILMNGKDDEPRKDNTP